MAISYGKMVIIGAGKVGSAILNSVLRMNILDEIVVVNRNQKKALGEVLDASHTTAFAYSANANIHVGGYEECADAQIIVVTAGPSIQPGNSRDRMVLLEKNVNVMNDIMEQITRYTREAIIIVVSNPLDILTYIAQKKFDYPAKALLTAAKRTTAGWCADAVRQCQVLDRRMKSEKGMDAAGELKLLLVRLGAGRK